MLKIREALKPQYEIARDHSLYKLFFLFKVIEAKKTNQKKTRCSLCLKTKLHLLEARYFETLLCSSFHLSSWFYSRSLFWRSRCPLKDLWGRGRGKKKKKKRHGEACQSKSNHWPSAGVIGLITEQQMQALQALGATLGKCIRKCTLSFCVESGWRPPASHMHTFRRHNSSRQAFQSAQLKSLKTGRTNDDSVCSRKSATRERDWTCGPRAQR